MDKSECLVTILNIQDLTRGMVILRTLASLTGMPLFINQRDSDPTLLISHSDWDPILSFSTPEDFTANNYYEKSECMTC